MYAPLIGVEHSGGGNITVATRIMQSFFNELSTSVSDNAKCKQTKFDTYALNSLGDVESQVWLRDMSSAWRKERLVSILA